MPDDRPTAISYLNALNPTPNVQLPMTPSCGSCRCLTVRARHNINTCRSARGALQLLQEVGPFLNIAIAYQYDALGRVVTRTVDGNTETYSDDPLGRLVEHADISAPRDRLSRPDGAAGHPEQPHGRNGLGLS